MKRIDQVVLVGGDSLQVGIYLSEVITARLQVRHTQPDCILVQLAEAKLLGLFRADPLASA
jgi:hypothetical protein